MSSEESPKPIVAFVLSLVGGIISLVPSSIWLFNSLNRLLSERSLPIRGWVSFGMTLLYFVAAIVVMVGSYTIYADPKKTKTWGVIILVFSILSVFSIFSGGILSIIGGLLAISWKPTPPPTPISAITRICPKCGHVLKEEKIKFCPYCGNELA